MALSIYVQGIPAKDSEQWWQVDNVAWPRALSEEDARFRVIDLSSAYIDHVAVLSTEEALEINRKYLDWNDTNKELQQKLEETNRSESMVLVRIYEWESGLGD